jgi:hypothetical protein
LVKMGEHPVIHTIILDRARSKIHGPSAAVRHLVNDCATSVDRWFVIDRNSANLWRGCPMKESG